MSNCQHQPQIWCFLDGKPGHENQTLGLVDALQRYTNSSFAVHEFRVATSYAGRLAGAGLPRNLRNQLAQLPKPDLILGTGHSTHIPIWRARRAYGGHCVVLMKPSLPIRLFDLCLIPDAHRITRKHEKLFVTRGVLNRIQPTLTKDKHQGLCLIGGPSPHFFWDEERLLHQLHFVISAIENSNIRWTIAASRRTPESTRNTLRAQFAECRLVFPEEVSRDWLPENLRNHGSIWVSEDSISMIYEAVTSAAQVGLLQLERKRNNRVTMCVDNLIQDGYVTTWTQWNSTHELSLPPEIISESDRAASEILTRFLPMLLAQPLSETTAKSQVA